MSTVRLRDVLVLTVALSLLLAPPAYAYLDPGVGSMTCQVMLAAVVSTAFLVKLYWQRIRGMVARLFSIGEKE